MTQNSVNMNNNNSKTKKKENLIYENDKLIWFKDKNGKNKQSSFDLIQQILRDLKMVFIKKLL